MSLNPQKNNNLLKPALETDPNPLRVSTFAEPEYGTLTFHFGVDHTDVRWPIYCQQFTISIPTGRKATALTGDPQLIEYSASPVHGHHQGTKWNMQRNTTDPNKAVFDCVPETTTAKFDGTWQVSFTLRGIELNGAIGPVSITIDEHTSRTESGGYEIRTGRVEVIKRDDTFYFHSFRATHTIINRDHPVTLHWEGSTNAIYTMYYRDKNGHDKAEILTNPGGTWTLQEGLLDNTNFTLKATINRKDYYQTTHLQVNNPNTTINQLTVKGSSTFDGIVTLKAFLTAKNGLSVTGTSTFNGTVTVNELLTAKKNLDVWYDTLHKFTTAGTNGIRLLGPLDVTGTSTLNGAVTVNQLLTAKRDLDVWYNSEHKLTTIGVASGTKIPGHLNVAGTSTFNGAVQINGSLKAGIITGTDYFYLVVSAGQDGWVAIRQDFRVVKKADQDARKNRLLWIDQANCLIIVPLKINGNLVICSGSTFRLYNTSHSEYLYAAIDDFAYDGDRRRVFTWRPGGPVGQGTWQALNVSNTTLNDTDELTENTIEESADGTGQYEEI
jgi:hypothetical protein